MQTYQELLDAMEAAHEWLLMLSDDAEISEDAAGAADFMREALARLAIGEEAPMPRQVDELVVRDKLRTWFEREIGPSK